MANVDSPADLALAVYERLADSRSRLASRDAAVLADQVALTRIPAPTGDEAERAAWVASRFRTIGLVDVRMDDAGNVVGRRPGRATAAPVAVCAHLDTVFPRSTELQVRHEAHRVVGPGITDNSRGLAVMLAIAEELGSDRAPLDRPVDFVATTGEEGTGDLRGAKHYFATDRPPAAAVIIDGAGDERIVHRALGSRRFRVVAEGPGGHSWSAFGVANAVHAMASAASAIARLRLSSEPRFAATVARIGGGLSINAIPGSSWMEIDVRSVSPGGLFDTERRIRAAVDGAIVEENARRTNDTPPLTVRIDVIGDRPSGETPLDHPLVSAAARLTQCIGRRPDLTLASTDANVPISAGIPAIAIGAGGHGGDTHTPAEWYDNTSGYLGVARALALVATASALPSLD